MQMKMIIYGLKSAEISSDSEDTIPDDGPINLNMEEKIFRHPEMGVGCLILII
jgi:hypothetical protein